MPTHPLRPSPPLATPNLTPTSQRRQIVERRIVRRQRSEVRVRFGESWIALTLAPALVILTALLLAFPADSGFPADWQERLVSWRALALAYQTDAWPAQVWAPLWAMVRAPFAAIDVVDRHGLADAAAVAVVFALLAVFWLRLLRGLGLRWPLRWLLWGAFFLNPLVLLTAGAGAATVVMALCGFGIVPALWRWTPGREAGPIITTGVVAAIGLMIWYAVVPLAVVVLGILFLRARAVRLVAPAAEQDPEREDAVGAILFAYLVPVIFAGGAVLWTRALAVGQVFAADDPLLPTGKQTDWWIDFFGAFADIAPTIRGWSATDLLAVALPAFIFGLPLLVLGLWALRRRHPALGAIAAALALMGVALLTLVDRGPTPFVAQLVGPLAAALTVTTLALSGRLRQAATHASPLSLTVAAGSIAVVGVGAGTAAVALATA